MTPRYPTPVALGLTIPADLRQHRLRAGFAHGIKGGQLDHVEYLRYSFRPGFRASTLYLRRVRRTRSVVAFPMRVRLRAT
jgi:hypothetical protein